MGLKSKQAQNTLEYAVLITAVIVGLLAMNSYLKRSVQGKLKTSGDDLGSQFAPGLVTYNWKTYNSGQRLETTTPVIPAGGTIESAKPIQRSEVQLRAGASYEKEITHTWGNETIQPDAADVYDDR